MKKYYLHNGNEQEGPFDIHELKAKNISLDTQIWYEGLVNWTTAQEIHELKDIFSGKMPPPFKPKVETNVPASNPVQKKNNFSKRTAAIVVALIGIVCFLLYVQNNKSSGVGNLYEGINPETYEQKVMTVEEIERAEPTKFLDAGGTYRVALFKKIKINGVITNSATVATYKDAVIRITYYTKTNTVLHEKEFTVYESFPPTSSKNFEWKVDNYLDVETIGWDIISATAQ